MLKQLSHYIWLAAIAGALTAAVIANSRGQGFREKLLDYIDDNALVDEVTVAIDEPSDPTVLDERFDLFSCRSGDWEDYVVDPRYRNIAEKEKMTSLYRGDDVRIETYGFLNLDLKYGQSIFTRKRYQEYSGDKPKSELVQDGFSAKQDLQIHVEGTIGDRMSIYIDHDSRKKDNRYMLKYRAVRDDELIRELNAGEIDINFKGSRYAVYDNNTAKGLGVDLKLQKNRFTFKAFGSVTRGNTEVETYRGNSMPGNIKLSEYQYVKGVYYQIEPYIRYDNNIDPPHPSNYTLKPVNINPYGFEIYMDDQDPYNKQNIVELPAYGGLYRKMQAGVDYKINFSTGLLQFIRPVQDKARIFAVYNLMGSSTDPSALQPGDPRHPGGNFSGRIFVFLKYGYSLSNDPVSPPNHPAPDVYEVRSFYVIGDKYILPNNFSLSFFMENGVMSQNDIASLGTYSVDYTNGVIQFVYREPYRQLLGANGTAARIYAEHQPTNVYDFSRYRIKIDYYRDARSFQLNHLNVIPNSVVVKVDRRTISETLYTVDYTAGYITFNSATNPLIGPETVIEIRYEYLPIGTQGQEFVGGFRGEYEFSRDLKVGGSMLYSRTGSDEKVPAVGTEPTQTVFVEGDATLHLDGRRLAQFANIFTRNRRKELPIEINGYAEYAKSYKNMNTFGKAMIDNMESSEEAVVLSLDERDWIYSSPPSALPGAVRGILNYYYYRDAANPTILKGVEYSALAPKVAYSVKAGPYNVATGHVLSTILSLTSQRSLVLDFEDNHLAGSGDYVSIVTRDFSKSAVDLSSMQYAEISYRYEGTTSVDLYLDIGKVNEDSGGDGGLQTEDLNLNGILDSDPVTGFTEDIGYLFQEAGHPETRIGGGAAYNRLTIGDGVLTSEDLNQNGTLDTLDNVYSFQGHSVPLVSGIDTWQVARLYVDPSAMTQSEINLLREVESVRLYVRKTPGDRGRLFIDSVKFVSSKWREARLGTALASPDQMKVSAINCFDDDEYRWEAFSLVMKSVYKAMYGVKSDQDLLKEKETSLKLEYAIPAGSRQVSVTRRFAKAVDFRNYRSLSAWMNFRAFSPGDRVGIIVGSSDTDYLEYQMNMTFPRVWQEMKMRLKNKSESYLIPVSMSGRPDLKRITMMKIIIYSSAPPSIGSLWVDEIYLSEPEILEDTAHWYEGELKVNKPFHVTKGGVPIMSDFSVKYVQKGHGSKFSTIGKKDLDMAEEYKQVFSSFNIIPNWNTRVDYIREDSETDGLNEEVDVSQRGKTNKNSVVFITDYQSEKNWVPSIKLMYKYDDYNNKADERISSYSVKRLKTQLNHSPVIHCRQTIEKFLWGRWTSEVLMTMLFKKDQTKRSSYEMSMIDLNTMASILEIEKRQRSDIKYNLDYTHRVFYVRPAIQVGSEEIVAWIGKSQFNRTDLLYNFRGDYHFPFVYNSNCRYVERSKNLSLSAGLSDFSYIAPGYKIDIQYFENKFRDFNLESASQYGYKRAKDAQTLVATTIDIPVYFYKIKALKSLRTFSINYNRSLFLTEANVPYEGERKDPLDERYGITRTVSRLSNAAFNVFQYYPFCFFLGRNNYARGRDYLCKTLNRPIIYKNGTNVSDYNNNLRLQENFSVAWSVDLDKVNITSNSGLQQLCERQDVLGVPGQTVNANFEINVNFDLMKLLRFWFFRPNREGIPYHAAFLTVGYKFDINMLITQNIEETVHSPNAGMSFKRDRASLTLQLGICLKNKNSRSFIPWSPLKLSLKDYLYFQNMPFNVFFKDKDTAYTFTALFETDVKWIFKFFSLFYRLAAMPIFNLEYAMNINRYDYLLTTSPQPLDSHVITTKLILDLHKNIQGGLNTRVAVEQYRNRKNLNYYNLKASDLKREVFSYEVGATLTILF
ncbi:MAG: hypothetical protein KA369_04030 [Spirochaetes bacterium]|nr:hypothetical protein [Spirochaetota bacterium]